MHPRPHQGRHQRLARRDHLPRIPHPRINGREVALRRHIPHLQTHARGIARLGVGVQRYMGSTTDFESLLESRQHPAPTQPAPCTTRPPLNTTPRSLTCPLTCSATISAKPPSPSRPCRGKGPTSDVLCHNPTFAHTTPKAPHITPILTIPSRPLPAAPSSAAMSHALSIASVAARFSSTPTARSPIACIRASVSAAHDRLAAEVSGRTTTAADDGEMGR